MYDEFQLMLESNKIDDFVKNKNLLLTDVWIRRPNLETYSHAIAFGLLKTSGESEVLISPLGKDFFKWYTIENKDVK
jgi:hypothetical protein